ncbi:uncharacterized protein LOC103182499 [Callorhinchus milii]|uniref:uncharacterized protein LOC103182499 n=1 Tax=Callorhinchus milii TaxID=7868 RepID=UPI001C3F88B8|nr:uncharacterized protein LOC103182499 [Callorhinchus milii]
MLSKTRPFLYKEGKSEVDADLSLQQLSTDRASDSNSNRYGFQGAGIGYGRNRAEEETKPSAMLDSERDVPGFPYSKQLDDEVVNKDKHFDAALSTPKSPYSSTELTPSDTWKSTNSRSPLDLLMAAKQRDAKRKSQVQQENKGFQNHINSEAPGGTQYNKAAITNTFRVTPYHTEQKLTSSVLVKPEFNAISHRTEEREMAKRDMETPLFLIPPPPSFSDEGSEDFSFKPLPPPLEFSNREDDGVSPSQPQAKVNGRMAIGRPPVDYHSTPNHYNGPTDGKSYSPYQRTTSVGSLSSLAMSSDKTRPLLATKPTFVPSRGSPLLSNSSPPHSLPMGKAYAQNTPKMDHQSTQPSADKLGGESRVIAELQSHVDTNSTQDLKGSQRPQHLSYGRTFTVRPGAKQPISWN